SSRLGLPRASSARLGCVSRTYYVCGKRASRIRVCCMRDVSCTSCTSRVVGQLDQRVAGPQGELTALAALAQRAVDQPVHDLALLVAAGAEGDRAVALGGLDAERHEFSRSWSTSRPRGWTMARGRGVFS